MVSEVGVVGHSLSLSLSLSLFLALFCFQEERVLDKSLYSCNCVQFVAVSCTCALLGLHISGKAKVVSLVHISLISLHTIIAIDISVQKTFLFFFLCKRGSRKGGFLCSHRKITLQKPKDMRSVNIAYKISFFCFLCRLSVVGKLASWLVLK